MSVCRFTVSVFVCRVTVSVSVSLCHCVCVCVPCLCVGSLSDRPGLRGQRALCSRAVRCHLDHQAAPGSYPHHTSVLIGFAFQLSLCNHPCLNTSLSHNPADYLLLLCLLRPIARSAFVRTSIYPVYLEVGFLHVDLHCLDNLLSSGICQCSVGSLADTFPDEQESRPPIQVKFEIPYYTVSGLQVTCRLVGLLGTACIS